MKPQVIDIAVAMRQLAEKQQRDVLAVIKANRLVKNANKLTKKT